MFRSLSIRFVQVFETSFHLGADAHPLQSSGRDRTMSETDGLMAQARVFSGGALANDAPGAGHTAP
jgi:hypothetical protein